jgi:uncharacterized protein YutE (UPF0331/DUF86 family)
MLIGARFTQRFLAEAGYLDARFGEAMMAMVALRNRLVRLYWPIDVELLYRSFQQDVALLDRVAILNYPCGGRYRSQPERM